MINDKEGIYFTWNYNNNEEKKILIKGGFNIPLNGGFNIANKLHQAIVMIVTFGGVEFVIRPYEDFIIFLDDVKLIDSNIHGSFDIDIMQYLNYQKYGTYYILFSLGPYLSNLEKIVRNKN